MSSPISVCWRLRISVAKRSSEPPMMAIAARSAAWRSRWTIWVLTGSTWRPSAPSTSASRSGPRWLYVPTGPEILPVADLVDGGREAAPAAIDLEGPAGELQPERRRLGVDASGSGPSSPCRPRPGRGATSAAMSAVAVARAGARRPPGAGARAPVSTTSLLVRPRWRKRPSGPTVSATWLTNAMTSWSVVCSISAIRSTSTRARASMRRERVGRDEAAAGLGAGDRELDPEHRLEAGLLGPDRAHLGQRVARDHRRGSDRHRRRRARPMSWRRCEPVERDRRPRRARRRRARPRRSGPAADDREDPAAVRLERRRRRRVAGPGVEDECARAPRASRPVDRGRRGAGRPGSPPPARTIADGRARAGPARRRRAARPTGPSGRRGRPRAGAARARRPRRGRIDLRLGVAEAGVALEQDRAVGGQHQPGVERAAERRPAPGQLGEDRPVEPSRRTARRASSGRSASGE